MTVTLRIPKVVIVLLPLLAPLLIACGWLIAQSEPASQPSGKTWKSPGGVTITQLTPPNGAQKGDIVRVHYTGTLTNGTKFDSSVGKEPIELSMGAAQVIKGWEEGLTGMQVGEKRHLVIPPEIAYGAKGRGEHIPPNATLEFDVELVGLFRQ